MKWPWSLELLPVQGVTSPIANIEFIRGRLLNTLTIIDGALKYPTGVPTELRQRIYNIRFHVVVALGILDGALRSGYSPLETANTVDGLAAAIDSHITAIKIAKPLWRQFLVTESRGFSDVQLPLQRTLAQVAQPVSTGDYIGAGAAAAGLYQLSRAVGDGLEDWWATDEEAEDVDWWKTNEDQPMLEPDIAPVDLPPIPPPSSSGADGWAALAVLLVGGWLIFRKKR